MHARLANIVIWPALFGPLWARRLIARRIYLLFPNDLCPLYWKIDLFSHSPRDTYAQNYKAPFKPFRIPRFEVGSKK